MLFRLGIAFEFTCRATVITVRPIGFYKLPGRIISPQVAHTQLLSAVSEFSLIKRILIGRALRNYDNVPVVLHHIQDRTTVTEEQEQGQERIGLGSAWMPEHQPCPLAYKDGQDRPVSWQTILQQFVKA